MIILIIFLLPHFIGFVYQWALVLLAELWLLHLIHLFIKIAFPIWARKLDRKQIKFILHVVEVSGAVFLCTLAPTLHIIFQSINLGDSLQFFVFHPKKSHFIVFVYHCVLYWELEQSLLFLCSGCYIRLVILLD